MSKCSTFVRSIAVLAVALGISATREAPAQGTAPPVETLNLAIASSAIVYGPVWIAIADRLFEKNGVQVNVVNTNALTTGSAMLVSGQADLLVTTAFLGLRIATEGKPLSYVINLSNMGARINAFISKPEIKSVEQLAALGDKCRVILLPTGTATWAIYKGVAGKYKLGCSVSSAGTPPLVLASALSGQFDAAMVNPQDAYGARDAGRANVLIDPLVIDDATANQLYPYQHPLSTVLGLRSNLEAKRGAVIRFVRALRQANEKITASTPAQLGEMTVKLTDVFASTPVSALTQQWQIQKALFPQGPTAGFISASEWNALIAAAPAVWGFANLDPNNPTVRYENIVDMSYFNSTTK